MCKRGSVRQGIPLFALLIFLLSVGSLYGELREDPLELLISKSYDFPENTSVRKMYQDVIFSDYPRARMEPVRVLEDEETRKRVRFAIQSQNGSYYILFVNELDYSFPLYSKGTYIIKRNIQDGSFTQIKVFIQSHAESFVRIFPDGERVRLSLFLYGYPLYRDVLLPINIDTAAVVPFAKIIDLTSRIIDWELIFPNPNSYDNDLIVSMVQGIRNNLPLLKDEDDGAMDHEGRFVYIETMKEQDIQGFNCSGFAKWVVDGLYYPLTGSYMPIPLLKAKGIGDRGNRWSDRYEEEEDPYFGLDWTRNIAYQLCRASYPEKEVGKNFADVRNLPFFRYTDDLGYRVEHLQVILYLLSRQDPGHFYLASINDQTEDDVSIRKHFHVAIIFPYYTEDNRHRIAIFERNSEVDIDSFMGRYPRGYVHLVRIPVLSRFEFPMLNYAND
jgi:hypothetical protein